MAETTIKASVFLSKQQHQKATRAADKEKLSLSRWVAKLVAERLTKTKAA